MFQPGKRHEVALAGTALIKEHFVGMGIANRIMSLACFKFWVFSVVFIVYNKDLLLKLSI